VRDTFLPLSSQLITYLTRHAAPPVLDTVVPPLVGQPAGPFEGPTTIAALCSRPETSALAAKKVQASTAAQVLALLQRHRPLHPELLDVAAQRFGRRKTIAEHLAGRDDLTPRLAARLTRQRRLHPLLARNDFLPANASWKVLGLPQLAGIERRYTPTRAANLAAAALNEAAGIPQSSPPSTAPYPGLVGQDTGKLAREALRILPPGPIPFDTVNAVRRCHDAGVINSRSIVAAACRTRSVDLSVLAAQLDPSNFILHLCRPVYAGGGTQVIPDRATAEAILCSDVDGSVRDAALTNPACVQQAVAALQTGSADGAVVAANPAIPRDVAVELAADLGEDAYLVMACQNLRLSDRVALAAGVARQKILVVLAAELCRPVDQPWVADWLHPDVVGAMVTPIEEWPAPDGLFYLMDRSTVLRESAQRYPLSRPSLVEHVDGSTATGTWEVWTLVETLGDLDDDELRVFSALLPHWNETFTALCGVASALAGTDNPPGPQ
jgi:hypothetical protein